VLEELPDEAALADPRNADERHELRLALLPHSPERRGQRVQLTCAPDEPRTAVLPDVHAEARACLDRFPHRHGSRFALRLDGLRLVIVDHVPGRALRLLADENPVHRSRGLESRRGVDDVAGDDPLAGLGPCVERDERFAGVHCDPHLDVPLLARPVADRERRPYRPLGVVLPGDRRTEDRDDGVADELLDRPAPALELAAQPLVVGAEDRGDVFGVEGLRPGCEADEVGEEDGHDLALLPRVPAHAIAVNSASASRT
jgi:hypothetical protein